jgi:hypothetical protein
MAGEVKNHIQLVHATAHGWVFLEQGHEYSGSIKVAEQLFVTVL